MSLLIEILKTHGEEPVSAEDLVRAFSNGYRVFQFHDMDGEDDEPVEVHSVAELEGSAYAYDQHLMLSPEHLPENLRFAPEKRFYVSMLTGKILGDGQPEGFLLAGPFADHDKALSLVDKARDTALLRDPRCWFYSFGTVGVTASRGTFVRGGLNTDLDVEPEGV